LTAKDLALAYTPGVAWPCLEINKDPNLAYKYTTKGNLVGVISNGTAVLGLGNIGAIAGKPVMEGKGVLFKRFADVDVFDIEVNEESVDGMVQFVTAIAPTFGGINLEDIKAPECFEIERRLVETLDIPVFHDDQHGTAIIASAGFINALEVAGKKIDRVNVVFNGAGAAAIACANLMVALGLPKKNILMCDTKGVIYKGRKDGMNSYKESFAVETKRRSLADAMNGADVFIGCSVRGALSPEMVKTMNENPIIFAMANPDPEIYPHEVHEVRKDAIVATGRSDFPNQVNNVLGFPFIFRGALDVRASKINEKMKIAAVYALANLAKEEVTREVRMAYGNKDFKFGREYLIPKPFDKRVLVHVTTAVAKAAMESGVARNPIADFQDYAMYLERRLGTSADFSKQLRDKVAVVAASKKRKIKVCFTDGNSHRVLHAVQSLIDEGHFSPVLVGRREEIEASIKEVSLESILSEIEIFDPHDDKLLEKFSSELYEKKQRYGVAKIDAKELMKKGENFGAYLLNHGLVDVLLAGPTKAFREYYAPLVHNVNPKMESKTSGNYILVYRDRILFLADCAVHVDPTPDELADITFHAAELFRKMMHREPVIAMLSFSNFGTTLFPQSEKVRRALDIIKKKWPNLNVDGEMQADVAVNHAILEEFFPFTTLKEDVDVLIFPELNSANISYKLLNQLSDADVFGPILAPMERMANILQRTATPTEITNMALISASLLE